MIETIRYDPAKKRVKTERKHVTQRIQIQLFIENGWLKYQIKRPPLMLEF